MLQQRPTNNDHASRTSETFFASNGEAPASSKDIISGNCAADDFGCTPLMSDDGSVLLDGGKRREGLRHPLSKTPYRAKR